MRLFDIGAGVRGVVRIPDAEDIAGKEGGRAGQLGEGVQRTGVVMSVHEQVAVLGVSPGAPGLDPSVRGPGCAVGVVQQPPSGAGEQAIGVQRFESGLAPVPWPACTPRPGRR